MSKVLDQIRKMIAKSEKPLQMMGREADIQASQLLRIRDGIRDPRLSTFERIANYFGFEIVLRKRKGAK